MLLKASRNGASAPSFAHLIARRALKAPTLLPSREHFSHFGCQFIQIEGLL